jgi:hypothetical protein
MTRLEELLEDFYVEYVPGLVTPLNPCGKFLATARRGQIWPQENRMSDIRTETQARGLPWWAVAFLMVASLVAGFSIHWRWPMGLLYGC